MKTFLPVNYFCQNICLWSRPKWDWNSVFIKSVHKRVKTAREANNLNVKSFCAKSFRNHIIIHKVR